MVRKGGAGHTRFGEHLLAPEQGQPLPDGFCCTAPPAWRRTAPCDTPWGPGLPAGLWRGWQQG